MYMIVPALTKCAAEFAGAAQGRIEGIKSELAEASAREAKAKEELKLAQSAAGRVDSFQPQNAGGMYQCPRCWVEDETMSDLKPINSETNADCFRCNACGGKFSSEV